MIIQIYQINMGRDNNRVAFQSLDTLSRLQGTSEINSEIYDKVFTGEVNAGNLEDVYRIFVVDQPSGYKGRALSVSDVVEIIFEEGKSTFNYCDSIGFKEIDFDPDLTEELKEEKIKVVLCEPGKNARITEISNTLAKLQATVKGDIEAFYPFDEAVCIVCNEEGKFNGMEPCRGIFDDNGVLMDIIFGPFFVCDCSGHNFGSLNEEQLKRFFEQYRYPERVLNVNGEIICVKQEAR